MDVVGKCPENRLCVESDVSGWTVVPCLDHLTRLKSKDRQKSNLIQKLSFKRFL